MKIKEIRWKRGDVEIVLDLDRKALVPLLRRTALDRISVGGYPTDIAFDGAYIWVTPRLGYTLETMPISLHHFPT